MKTRINLLGIFALLSSVALAQNSPSDVNSLLSQERFDKAKNTLIQQAQQSPSAETQFAVGYSFLRAGWPDSARIWFEKGVAFDEKRVPLNQTGLALAGMASKGTTAAEPQLQEVLDKSKGKNASILYRIGEAYTGYLIPDSGSIKPRYPKMVNPAKALEYLNRAAERDKKNGNIQLALGDAHYLNKDAGMAVTRYETALELGISPARVYQRIGDIYWQGRNLNLAVENYKKAIEANPSYAPAYSQLAELYFQVNRYKDAAHYMDQYVHIAGDSRAGTILRDAQFNFLANNFQRAVNVIDSNRTTLSDNPIVYRIQGWAYSSLKEPQKAIDHLQLFLEKAPQKVMPDDYKYLGRAYLASETNDSLGVVYLQKAAPFDTTDNLYSEMAKYYYRAKKHPQAVAALDSAAKLGFKADMQDLFRYGMSNYTLGFARDSLGKLQRDTLRFAKADSALALAQQGAPEYAPTVLYRAKANYYAYTPEEAVLKGKAKPFFEQFIAMVAAKDEERKRYEKDLGLAFKYLISYHELVSKDDTARQDWLKRGIALLPDNKELTQIAMTGVEP